MISLIQNEQMKLFARPRTWILVLVLIGIVVWALSFVLKETGQNDWRKDVEQQIENDRLLLKQDDLLQTWRDDIQRQVAVNEYRLANQIPPEETTLWGGVLFGLKLMDLVTIIVVLVAADIIAFEFNMGTIKFLLTCRYSRTAILISKYITVILYAWLMLVILFGSSLIMSGIWHGFGQVGSPYLYVTADLVVHEKAMFVHALQSYGYASIELFMVVTLAFMISAVFRSSMVAMLTAIGATLFGTGVANYWAEKNVEWSKYFLFQNTDLTSYLTDQEPIAGMTMSFSVAVLIVYFFIFLGLAWSFFRWRDAV